MIWSQHKIRMFFLVVLAMLMLPPHVMAKDGSLQNSGNIRIALVQMESSPLKESNLAKIKTFTMDAACKNVRIICFPELSVTGYERENPEPLAETLSGPSSKFLSKLSMENKITILSGLIEKDQGRYYITQLVTFPDGRIEAYRKTHLGRREKRRFSPGMSLPVFKSKIPNGGEICFAIGICYDMHFPEIAAIYSKKGAQIIFSPHASPLGGEKRIGIWDRYFGARAYDNSLYTAACNHIEHHGADVSGGGAGVWEPFTAMIIKKTTGKDETMLICDLDLDGLKKTRSQTSKTFFLKDRRETLYLDHSAFSF